MKVARRLFTLLLILAVAIVAGRLSLPFLARNLIRSDPLKHADVIVVLAAVRIERTIEAGTLYREGWAPRIMLMRATDVTRDSTRPQMGLHFPVFLDVQRDVLAQMRVPPSAVSLSPRTQESTEEEAVAVAQYARQNGLHRIIVVTSPYHTARAAALFDRAANGSYEMVMHPDRYEPVHSDRWWTAFPDRYDVVDEYLKRIYALFFRG